eukprot:9341436-Heterocapsa_arctica.AAC.1
MLPARTTGLSPRRFIFSASLERLQADPVHVILLHHLVDVESALIPVRCLLRPCADRSPQALNPIVTPYLRKSARV